MIDARPQPLSRPGTAPGRRLGASLVPGGVEFAVWAPDVRSVAVDVDDVLTPLERDEGNVWSAFVPGVGAGARYRFRLNDEWSYPDPYSRSQPEGPHGPSEIVDPAAYSWRDDAWQGLRARGLVIYECHVGIHTREGTFDALAGDLDALRGLGITAIELMPVAEFPGNRNWGYDGVNPFAPSHVYGGPDALKRLVDAAHERGIGVILDVVYNHFGPDGNYLQQYARDYMTDRYRTPWGDAINFDGPNSEWVRRYFIDNARYWLQEYHVDGLRLDAAFAIHDSSTRHILQEIVEEARASVPRPIVLIAETYENDVRYITPVEAGGFGFDAIWADDFHHAVHAAASHDHSGYYVDYTGTVEELARVINRGWLYEGQYSRHFEAPRGTPAADAPAHAFVYCIQNHDQVGNRAFGRRFSHLTGIAEQKQWAALMLLLPYTPMIFAGEEFVASTRFQYFSDHQGELGRAVTEGRRAEAAQYSGALGDLDTTDPQAEETFLSSKLELHERQHGAGEAVSSMYRTLLALRRDDPVLRQQDRRQMHAVAASRELLLVRLRDGNEQRLIVWNPGLAIDAPPAAAGIPADVLELDWRVVFSTEDRRFGGTDDRVRFDSELIAIPPHTTVLLASAPRSGRARWSAIDHAARRLLRSAAAVLGRR